MYRARGIKSRREENEAIGGFFSHIGELYNVHHLWGKLVSPSGCAPQHNTTSSHVLVSPWIFLVCAQYMLAKMVINFAFFSVNNYYAVNTL